MSNRFHKGLRKIPGRSWDWQKPAQGKIEAKAGLWRPAWADSVLSLYFTKNYLFGPIVLPFETQVAKRPEIEGFQLLVFVLVAEHLGGLFVGPRFG